LAEVVDGDALGKLVAEQRARRVGDQDLAAVACRRDPRRAHYVEPEVTLVADVRLAGAHAHAHRELPSVRPLVVEERPL
jgi:hypothetical protein